MWASGLAELSAVDKRLRRRLLLVVVVVRFRGREEGWSSDERLTPAARTSIDLI
jgi:hypothetical protein